MVEQDDYFDEMLDETYPSVNIGGIEFPASRILRELAPIAYNEMGANYYDSLGMDWDEEE